jgi:hypothetical protein
MAMEEVEDEPLFCDRVAGIDIGKATVMVTVRVPSETRKGGRQQETREFGTTRRELLALADWLRCWQVEKAGMESTSVIRGANGMKLDIAQVGPCRTRPRWQLRGAPSAVCH